MSRRVFEEDLVAKNNGDIEKELSPNATVRFELDNAHYSVSINESNELRIYKTARGLPQTDSIKLRALSSNIFCLS